MQASEWTLLEWQAFLRCYNPDIETWADNVGLSTFDVMFRVTALSHLCSDGNSRAKVWKPRSLGYYMLALARGMIDDTPTVVAKPIEHKVVTNNAEKEFEQCNPF